MTSAEDQASYYRVPLDARSLAYEVYFDEGDRATRKYEDYTSGNTERLDLDETYRSAHAAARDAGDQRGGGRMKVLRHRKRRVPGLAHPMPGFVL